MNAHINAQRPVTVVIVDDSAIIRGLISRILRESPDIHICATANNGHQAITAVREHKPDIVLLDHEMPEMDGLTALPQILEQSPSTKIILCSSLTDRGADITVRGLALGATDFVLKPSALSGDDNRTQFKDLLLGRILSVAGHRQSRSAAAPHEPAAEAITLRANTMHTAPSILAIASSTGGPHALTSLFKALRPLPVPVLITQHMPPKFTRVLAEQLDKAGPIRAHEGEDGMIVQSGHAYIAPGDYHMVIDGNTARPVLRINQNPPENFCRPAADPMLRSLLPLYGGHILACVLTGMGQDGLLGCQDIARHGGAVIAQDKDTAVVWGMPGAVARAGICNFVGPIDALANHINNAFGKRAAPIGDNTTSNTNTGIAEHGRA